MVISSILILLGLLSFLIPRKALEKYFLFTAVFISLSFVFYNPPETDDLFRYYGVFNVVKNIDLSDIIKGNYSSTNWLYNYLISDYWNNSKVFMIIMYIISRTGIKELLPIVFLLLTYVPMFSLICKIGGAKNVPKNLLCLTYMLILSVVDFRMVSMLRQLSAYSLFVYMLYTDLVLNKKKLVCFVGYFLLCELHMSCVILLSIRVIIFATRKRLKYVMILLFFTLFTFSRQIIYLLRTYFFRVSFLLRLAQRISDYNIGRTSYNLHGAIFFAGSIFVVVSVYMIMHKKGVLVDGERKFGTSFVLATAFTIGSVQQYDVLIRNTKLLVMMCLPFIIEFMNEYVVIKSGRITILLDSENIRGGGDYIR